MKRVTLLVLTALMGISNHASGQTAEQMILLQNNPGLGQKIRSHISNQKNLEALPSGVPTSKEPRELDANDFLTDPDLVTQSIASADSEDSVIQQYYRVLSEQTLPIYGSLEFSQRQDQSLLFFNTMGKNYRLAAGDVLRVTIRGRTMGDGSYKIGRDGNLILPNLAPLPVSGATITEAEEKLLDILRLDDAVAAVFISLETARLITVQVSGAVASPRTIAVPAYTPLSRVLAYAGGIKPTGSLRNIVLRDRDGSTQSVDFYDFLQSPTGSNDPLVTDSSRIFVGNQGKTVGALGFVSRPGIYELQEGSENISVAELLKLTGTSVIPPGAEFEALFFDQNGITSKRKIDRLGFLNAGEVLDLRFVETSLQGSIEVVGAVLNEYKMASTKPVSLQKLLKNGTVLKRNAVLDFALLISNSGETQTLSLRDKILDPSFFVPLDTKLVVLSTAQYRNLLNSDPNRSDDPIVSAIDQSDRIELFLNGKKIAFIPPTEGKIFADVLKYHYRLTPKTSLDLAIIEGSTGQARSVDLQSLLDLNKPFTLSAGQQFHLFETKFLEANSQIIDPTQAPQATTSFYWKTLKRLFSRANVIQVKLDNQTRGFLPENTKLGPVAALEMLGFDDFGDLSDLILVESRSNLNQSIFQPSSLLSGAHSPSEGKIASINIFRDQTIKKLIADKNSELFSVLQDETLNLYLDLKLINFGLAADMKIDGSRFNRALTHPDIYPLFAMHRTRNNRALYWDTNIISLSDLLNQKFIDNLRPSDEIIVFTHQFIRSLSSRGVTITKPADENEPLTTGSSNQSGRDELKIRTTQTGYDRFSLTEIIKVMKANSRFVSGAVGTPGFYPTSNTVSLAQLISIAGTLTENADISKVQITKLKTSEGRIVLEKVEEYNLDVTPASEILMTGLYNVYIPSFINDASTGVVTLRGEIERPGQYIIGRDETLHDLIDRAGGFTSVAYPLGAIFTRSSLIPSQKEGNEILARQVEEAVLNISQSEDKTGIGEQMTAVLGYAKQLRQQEVSGRLTVNVLQRNKSAPIYLQDGDVLMIPKRPGHVSIIGSVQKNTVASYSEGKRLSDYLGAAGGVNRISDRGLTYVVLPNGESKTLDNDSIIPPGSVIVVPPKTDRLSALSFTEIVSRILGNIALSVLAISNAR